MADGSRPAAAGFARGRYAVVANQASADLYVFRLDTKGRLRQIGEPVSSGGPQPADMVVGPTGRVAISDGSTGEVTTFFLDRARRARAQGPVPRSGSGGRHRDAWERDLGDLSGQRRGPCAAASAYAWSPSSRGRAHSRWAARRRQRRRQGSARGLPTCRGRPVERDREVRAQSTRRLGRERRRDVGLFVSAVLVDGPNVLVATLDPSGANQVRVLRPGSLRERTAKRIVLSSPPTSMTVAAARGARWQVRLRQRVRQRHHLVVPPVPIAGVGLVRGAGAVVGVSLRPHAVRCGSATSTSTSRSTVPVPGSCSSTGRAPTCARTLGATATR